MGGFLFSRTVFVFGHRWSQIAVGRHAIDDGFYRCVVTCKFFYLEQVKVEGLVSAKRVVLGFFDLVAVYLSGRRRDVAFTFMQRTLDAGRRAFVLRQAKGIAKEEVDARGDGGDNVAPLVVHFVDDAVAFVDNDGTLADLCPAPGEEAFAQVSGFSLSACCRSGRRLFSCGSGGISVVSCGRFSSFACGRCKKVLRRLQVPVLP